MIMTTMRSRDSHLLAKRLAALVLTIHVVIVEASSVSILWQHNSYHADDTTKTMRTPAAATAATTKVRLDQLRGGATKPDPSSSSSLFSRFAGTSGGPGAGADPPLTSNRNNMPSLFTPNEQEYDKYACCLAATEGLRRIRDREMMELKHQHQHGAGPAAAADSADSGHQHREQQQQQQAMMMINHEYARNSAKVLRALGMSVDQFNDIGHQLARNDRLKEKVMEQAYLYRMSATIHMDRTPLIMSQQDDDYSRMMMRQSNRRRQQDNKLRTFCDCMSEIEQLRSSQTRRLMKSLHVEHFPDNVQISDPGLVPFLSARVRAVVEAFPLQAEEIVKRHQIDPAQFNQMLEESRTNPIFRWKVQRQLQQQKQQKQ